LGLGTQIIQEKDTMEGFVVFPQLLALSIIVKDVLQERGSGAERANEITMNVFEGMDSVTFRHIADFFWHGALEGEVTGNLPGKLKRGVFDLVGEMVKGEGTGYFNPEVFESLYATLHSRLVYQTLRDWRTCSDYGFERTDLGGVSELGNVLAFVDFISEEWGGKKFFAYPSGGRLKAILGDEFMRAPEEYELRKTEERVGGGAKAFAAILMCPWEADHLEKAGEMLVRGLDVARPLAKIISSGIEFGIFEWVQGEPLNMVEETLAWMEYGKILRRAHELGIVLEDAAGRNAMWDGKKITLIDFEHTWFMSRGEEVGVSDQTNGLRRVLTELSRRDPKLLWAFESGYGKSESLSEVECLLSRE